ncbi:hypothetical protein KC946_01655 [Candidatus Saccharibacteria bacterium]|nr:hypothetical protein [Candidatus Saccharibacteria bacterium]
MEWSYLLIGVVSATSVHRIMEPGNINEKVKRLSKAYETGSVEKPKLQGIDTRAISYGLGIMIIVSLSAFGYFIASIIGPDTTQSIVYSVVVLIIADIISMMAIDKYHVNIEILTKKFKK